jgi:hypothetical protein
VAPPWHCTMYITYYRPQAEQQELVRVDFSLQHN